MFSIIYTFKVSSGSEELFTKNWKTLTELIYTHCGSKGSRLHRNQNGLFIAYAVWPDRETWEVSNEKLPESALQIAQQMRICCESIDVSHQLEWVADWLR